jgi:hypothetical protein
MRRKARRSAEAWVSGFGTVRLTVADNGPAFSEALPRIFEASTA